MFTIVTQQKYEGKKLFTKKMQLSKVKQDGVAFALVQLHKNSGISNKKVLETIGNTHVVLSKSFEGFGGKTLHLVDEELYSFKLMEKGVEYLLRHAPSIPKNISVTLIDIQCKYQALADILIQHFNTLRIVTNRKQLYQNYVDTKLYDCGATVIIETDVKSRCQTSLYISPEGILFDEMNRESTPIISVRDIPNASATVIHSFRMKTPPKYHTIMPVGICEHSYQAALYNYCGIRDLTTRYPVHATVKDQELSLDEIVQMMHQSS